MANPNVPQANRVHYGSDRPSLRRAFGVFRNRYYRYLWGSMLFTFLGMQMQMITGAWIGWELTESFTFVGLVSVAMGLPMLFLSLIGGAVADRVNKRNLSLLTQTVMLSAGLFTGVMLVLNLLTIEMLIGVALVQGTSFAFSMPARQPLMASIVGPDDLMSAMALSNAAMNVTRLTGPAVAGALIALWGAEWAYFVQAGLYVIGLFLLQMVPAALGRPSGGVRQSVVREIGVGIRYVMGHPTLKMLLMMGLIPALFAMPYQMLLSGFVERDLGQGPSAFGFLQTMTGLGAVIGSLGVASLTSFSRKPLLQLGAGLTGGVGLILLGITATQWGYRGTIGPILLVGLALTTYQTLNMTIIMADTAQEYYGRVMSMMMVTFSVMPLMAAPLGVVADRIGAANLFMLQGATVVVLLLLMSLTNMRYVFSRTTIPDTHEPEPGDPGEVEADPPEAVPEAITGRQS